MIIIFIVKVIGGLWKLKNRINHQRNKYLKKIYIFIYKSYLREYSSYIGYTAKFEGIPVLPHGLHGVFISGDAKIGKNCVIFHQVTIGSNTLVDSKGIGAPEIGDNCLIGAGAKIIGDVNVGRNCRIGANCVVMDNVEDNSTVVMSKPRIITKDKLMNNSFYKQRTI